MSNLVTKRSKKSRPNRKARKQMHLYLAAKSLTLKDLAAGVAEKHLENAQHYYNSLPKSEDNVKKETSFLRNESVPTYTVDHELGIVF